MSNGLQITRLKITFSGSVQGVGFRYTSKQVSDAYQVSGTVRNLGNGRVEMICEGQRRVIEAFVREVSEKTHGDVADTHIEEGTPNGEFEGFTILR